MADDEGAGLTGNEKLERGVVRTAFNWLVILAALAVIAGWVANNGWVQIQPNEAAVVLRLGALNRIETDDGVQLLLPAPLEYAKVVDVRGTRHLSFGAEEGEDSGSGVAMQTADRNIVMVSYELQYDVGDAYSFEFGLEHPLEVLEAATQSAVREVVGRRSIDEMLSTARTEIEQQARGILQTTIGSYFESDRSPFNIKSIELQSVQPPPEVAEAFNDVVAAQQNEVQSVSEAKGDAREIMESASAKAREYEEIARAYKDAKIIEAQGEASRFEALLVEYQAAPEVTRQRLYLETMEQVLPRVDKMIVEPGTVNLLPFLGGQSGRAMAPAPAPVSAGQSSPSAQEGTK